MSDDTDRDERIKRLGAEYEDAVSREVEAASEASALKDDLELLGVDAENEFPG